MTSPDRAPPTFIARWDLDKTYLRTDFETFRDLLRTALERPDQKRTVPGAASLLRELSAAGGQIHILSGSPRQMRGRIEEKLRLDGARFDSLTLKPNLENMLRLRLRALRDQLGYKLPALLQSRAQQPHDGPSLPEVLLGDDAEADAFVYSLYADLCAGLVPPETLERVLELGHAYKDNVDEAVRLARGLKPAPCVRRILIHLERQSPPSRFAAYGPRVTPFYNYLQAALVLAEDALLPAGGVVRVAAEMVLDHRFDPDGLARSYLELRRRGCVRGDLVPALRQAIEHQAEASRFPAQQEVSAMCDLLEQQLPTIPPAPGVEEQERDYLALVVNHNPRKKRKK
jgi:hypothetical protein